MKLERGPNLLVCFLSREFHQDVSKLTFKRSLVSRRAFFQRIDYAGI